MPSSFRKETVIRSDSSSSCPRCTATTSTLDYCMQIRAPEAVADNSHKCLRQIYSKSPGNGDAAASVTESMTSMLYSRHRPSYQVTTTTTTDDKWDQVKVRNRSSDRSRRRVGFKAERFLLKEAATEGQVEPVKHKQRRCLAMSRRQIVSNGIPLMPFLFALLFVTTSALPPVIRIGKLLFIWRFLFVLVSLTTAAVAVFSLWVVWWCDDDGGYGWVGWLSSVSHPLSVIVVGFCTSDPLPVYYPLLTLHLLATPLLLLLTFIRVSWNVLQRWIQLGTAFE